MSMRPNVAIPFLSLVLSGCMSSGNESIADATSATVAAQLIKGKTTQADVRGRPTGPYLHVPVEDHALDLQDH
jgi:hypothetical protein